MTPLKFKKLHPSVQLPKMRTNRCWDIHAFLLNAQGRPGRSILSPRFTRSVGTGLAIQLPSLSEGWTCLILSLPSLANHSIFVAGGPLLIGPDTFNGEMRIPLYNGGVETYFIGSEDRIAQLICIPVLLPTLEEVE